MSVLRAAPPLAVTATEASVTELLGQENLLAILGDGVSDGVLRAADPLRDPRTFEFGAQPLADVRRQVIASERAVRIDSRPELAFAHDGDYFFAWLPLASEEQLEESTEAAYAQLLVASRDAGYPHLLRAWNYLVAINSGEGDQERYRRFCVGRYAAFARHARVPVYPPACALGIANGPSRVALLASRFPSAAIENPRQLSAFRYPRQYGPVGPSFSRAGFLPTSARQLVLVSGTAAIVGHVSLHPGDVVAQTMASLYNIEHVVAAAEGPPRVFASSAIDVAQLRVYLRHAADLPLARQVLAERVPSVVQVEWWQADVCRAELLVEIEAVFAWHPPR